MIYLKYRPTLKIADAVEGNSGGAIGLGGNDGGCDWGFQIRERPMVDIEL